jgi:DeoR/GlpR family transcriptional regulator of sugar metabolism
LLRRQSVLVGPAARKALEFYHIDMAFLGAEGVDAEGGWNSQEDVVELQKGLIANARQVILCADSTKLGRRAPVFLALWREIDLLVTDATAEAARTAGVPEKLFHQDTPQS